MYSRWGNPTADSACGTLSKLEGAAGSILFASGCAAISTTLFSFLKAGDHLVLNTTYNFDWNPLVLNVITNSSMAELSAGYCLINLFMHNNGGVTAAAVRVIVSLR